ncbi:MAG: hypothetical protein NDJ94_04215 [Vicinamibacteria bacterium]|jgi:hypothetical protein|nr:hypothetical protein [Vicinamibacteria bacterium]
MKRHEWPWSTALFVGLLLCSELLARAVVAPTGRLWAYWEADAGVKLEYVASRVGDLRALVVGDSTAAWNIEPAALQAGAAWDGEVVNVGLAGNFPGAFRCSTLPILEAAPRWPAVVIASFAPGAFNPTASSRRSQAGILDSPLCRSLAGQAIVQDWVHLTRLRGASRHLFRLWTGGPLLPAPPDGGYHNPDTPPRRPRVPAAGAARSKRGGRVDPESFAVLQRLARLASQRGARLVLLLPPTLQDWATYEEYARQVFALSDRDGAIRVADWRDSRGLGESEFADGVHLTRRGASVFSRLLGAELASEGPGND